MDVDKLSKLREKLYNETPFIGDRIRQQAIKELSEQKTPQSIEILTRALIFFNQDKKIKNKILNTLRQIKLQDKTLINTVCQIWDQNRDMELTTLLKVKGWVAYNPLPLRVLTAVNLGWQGIFQEKHSEIIPILLEILKDKDKDIQNTAREWLVSLSDSQLQAQVCKLASEENNQDALNIAISANYHPIEPSESALFYYFTQQWERYQEVDPHYQLLEEVYYSAPPELQERIETHSIALKRVEWVWVLLGGKQGRRVQEITPPQWKKILENLTNGRNWAILWDLVTFVPVKWSREIIKTLKNNRALPDKPEDKAIFAELLDLTIKIKGKSIPKGKLVRCIHTLEGHEGGIEAIALTPDDKILVSAGGDLIRLWDTNTGKEINTLKRHLNGVTSLALSEDGITLASGSRDKTVCVWRLPEGNILSSLSANAASVWSLSMTSDCKLIASASYREIRLWQYPSGKLYKTLTGFKTEVECTLISSDDSFLVGGGGKNDHKVRVWDLPSGELRFTLEGHHDAITSLAICPNNKILATGSKDNTIKLWSLTTGENISTLDDHTGIIWQIKITPDGKTLISVSEDGTVKLWQLETGNLLTTLVAEEKPAPIWCLDVSADGSLLATGGKNNTVRLWSLPDGHDMGVLQGHLQPIRQVKISGDRNFVITGSGDRTLKIWTWDLPNICNLPILAISPDQEKWLLDTIETQSLTLEEKKWLNLLTKLISLKKDSHQKSI